MSGMREEGEPDEEHGAEKRSKAFAGMIGAAALIAWFAMLWFMFGDVL